MLAGQGYCSSLTCLRQVRESQPLLLPHELILSALNLRRVWNQMEKAVRRRQVPAFGEWNYYYQYQYDEPESAAVAPPAVAYCPGYAATPEPEACSDVWFRYSPPPRKPTPAKKPRRRMPAEGDSDASLEKKGRRARPASEAGGGCGGLARATRVVRPVDEDLYQVPPPELASHRRRPRRRSIWMGCLGCVA